MKWLLIIIIMGANPSQSVTVVGSQEVCEAAKKEIYKDWKRWDQIRVSCVRRF